MEYRFDSSNNSSVRVSIFSRSGLFLLMKRRGHLAHKLVEGLKITAEKNNNLDLRWWDPVRI